MALGPVQDSVSLINANKDGLTFCGKRLYRIVDSAAVATFLAVDQDAQTMTIEAKREEDEGLYTIEVEVSL